MQAKLLYFLFEQALKNLDVEKIVAWLKPFLGTGLGWLKANASVGIEAACVAFEAVAKKSTNTDLDDKLAAKFRQVVTALWAEWK